jgi:tetratricopeptide (TPR) repeat protein
MKRLAVLLLSVATVPPVAIAQTMPETSRARDDDIILALSVDASITTVALQKANRVVREARDRLVATEYKLRLAFRRVSLGDRERATLKAELARVQVDERRLIETLRVKDVEFAAALAEYRNGLMGLLNQRDPRITAGLERYAAGDVTALDNIKELTRIIRRARDMGARANLAAQNAQSAADQRTFARLMLDAVGKGQKRTEDALHAWIEAAELEPGNADQWLEIARLKRSLGDTEGMMKAAVEFFELGTTDQQRANGWVFFSSMGQIPTPSSRQGGEGYGEALKLLRRLAEQDSQNFGIKITILSVLDVAVSSEISGLDAYPTTRREAAKSFATANALRAEGDGYAARLIQSHPTDDNVLKAVWQHWHTAARFTYRSTDAAASIALYGKSFAIARSRRVAAPDNLARIFDDAIELEDLAEVARMRGDYATMRPSLLRAATLKQQLAKADPGNVLIQRDFWKANIRVATVATAFEDFRTALDALAAALAVGRQVVPPRNGFSVETLARIALTQASTGDLKAATVTLGHTKALLDSNRPTPDFLAGDDGAVTMMLGDLALYRHEYDDAERLYSTLTTEPALPINPAATLMDQASSLRLAAHMRLAELALERGRITAARGYYEAIRDDVRARSALDGGTTILSMVAIMIGHLTPGFIGWQEIADGIDRDRGLPDAPYAQQPHLSALSGLIHTLAAGPRIPEQRESAFALASFDASAQIARKLANERPDDRAAAMLAISMSVARAKARGGHNWTEPLAALRKASARGWIVDDVLADATLLMVLARTSSEGKAIASASREGTRALHSRRQSGMSPPP